MSDMWTMDWLSFLFGMWFVGVVICYFRIFREVWHDYF